RLDVRLDLGVGVDRRAAAEEGVVRVPRVLDRLDELGPDLVVPLLVLRLRARLDLEGETESLHARISLSESVPGSYACVPRRINKGGAMQATSETRIEYSPALGRRVRLGSWEDQKVSTYRKIREAIEQERWDDAAELGNYFVDEAKVCFAIYRQWIPDLNGFLAENGVSQEELAAVNAEIVAKLDLPDGRSWDPYRQWHDFVTQVEELVALVHREHAAAALAKLDELKETWRQCHDRDVDHTYGLMSEIVKRVGESAIGPMWDKVL